MVTTSRLFTEEQLELMATPLSIRLERSAAGRDRAEIERVQTLMDFECLTIYDPYVQWTGVLQSFIVSHAGEDAHAEALRAAAAYAFRPFVLDYESLSFRERVEALAARLRASGSTFEVHEDEARVRFSLGTWGGAARQWRAAQPFQSEVPRLRQGNRYQYPCYGAYDPPTSFVTLSSPGAITQGRDELPCFFATEILFLEIIPIELLGAPLAVVTLPESSDSATLLDVYKDPADIPEDVFWRVELTKPRQGLAAETAARIFSDEELERLATPLSIQVETAAAAEDWDRLAQLSTGIDSELVGAKDPVGILIAGLLTWIARHLGEDQVEAALARTADVVMGPFVDAVRNLERAEATEMWSMVWRAHGSTFWVEEQDDVIVYRGRPLGACGRMWAHRYQTRVERISESRVRYPTFGCYDEPARFHLMREPRGITHMKTSYPIYSTHCHMLHEIYPIDQLGYPLWVEQHPLHDRDGETVHIHYKDTADWPEKYYAAVGRSKPI